MTATGYSENVLVDADWAKAHLDDPKVRFVEVDVDTSAYEQSHLPGAVGWNWTSQLSDGIRRDIAAATTSPSSSAQSGIAPDTTVILYGDNNNWFAAWAYWQLKMYGHRDVRILNGGRKFWLDNGLPLTTDVPSHPATGYASARPTSPSAPIATTSCRASATRRLKLVDVRSPAEYNGEVIAPPGMSETAQRAGRIPGAISAPWAQTVREDGTFKGPDELRAHYEGKGVSAGDDVIAYCRIGERSSHTWFVLHELLGYPRVRNYDGSWTEWGSMVNVPIEKLVAVDRLIPSPPSDGLAARDVFPASTWGARLSPGLAPRLVQGPKQEVVCPHELVICRMAGASAVATVHPCPKGARHGWRAALPDRSATTFATSMSSRAARAVRAGA